MCTEIHIFDIIAFFAKEGEILPPQRKLKDSLARPFNSDQVNKYPDVVALGQDISCHNHTRKYHDSLFHRSYKQTTMKLNHNGDLC